jgi:hypothetical protein
VISRQQLASSRHRPGPGTAWVPGPPRLPAVINSGPLGRVGGWRRVQLRSDGS